MWSSGKSRCSSALLLAAPAPLRIELRHLEFRSRRGELRVSVLFVSAHSISIEAVIQKEQPASDASVSIVIMTNRVVESVVNAALKELSALDAVVGEITRIRVAPTH